MSEPRTLTDLAGQITAAREKQLADKSQAQQGQRVYLPRSSNIPECARQGVYSIIAYDQKKAFDTYLLARFEEGDRQETWVMQALMSLGQSLGFRVVETQSTLPKEFVEQYGLTGSIDGKIAFDGRRVPVEIKSMNPNLFDNVKMVSDLISDPFYSRYYRQMLAYMKANNETECLLVLVDCLGHWRFIVVPFSEADFEEMVAKKVGVINDYVKRNEGKKEGQWELPDRIPYDPDHCTRCQFAHICLPDVMSAARVKFANDDQLAAMLERHEEIKPIAAEYKRLHEDELAEYFKAKREPLIVVGDFIVDGKATKSSKKLPAKDEQPSELRKVLDKLVEQFGVMSAPGWRWSVTRQAGESIQMPQASPVDAGASPRPPKPVSPLQDANQLLNAASTVTVAPRMPTPEPADAPILAGDRDAERAVTVPVPQKNEQPVTLQGVETKDGTVFDELGLVVGKPGVAIPNPKAKVKIRID